MNDRDLMWAAGLFEGEGCITSKRTRNHLPILHLSMVDVDVVLRFAMVVGVGRIFVQNKALEKSHYQKQYRWMVSREREVEQVMHLLLPWLGKRRQEKWLRVKEARERAVSQLTYGRRKV